MKQPKPPFFSSPVGIKLLRMGAVCFVVPSLEKTGFRQAPASSSCICHSIWRCYIDLLVVHDGNTRLIVALRGLKYPVRMIVLENVFADLGATISPVRSEAEKTKLKRNAFIFITAEPDSGKSALEDLKKIEGVNEVYLSHGAYDFVAKVSGESVDYLREIVFKQIKNLSSITVNFDFNGNLTLAKAAGQFQVSSLIDPADSK